MTGQVSPQPTTVTRRQGRPTWARASCGIKLIVRSVKRRRPDPGPGGWSTLPPPGTPRNRRRRSGLAGRAERCLPDRQNPVPRSFQLIGQGSGPQGSRA